MHTVGSNDIHACDEFSKSLRYYTFSFLPALIIRSTLPSPIHIHVSSTVATSRSVAVHLRPGDEQEICHMNIREKTMILQFGTPETTARHSVQLRRCDGFTKQYQFKVARDDFSHDQGCHLNAIRVLFTVHVDEECGQTSIIISSPLWMLNKCGARVSVLLPPINRSVLNRICIRDQDLQVLDCEPCFASKPETSKVNLLGFSGVLCSTVCMELLDWQ